MAQSGQPLQELPLSPLPDSSPTAADSSTSTAAQDVEPPSLWRKLLGRVNGISSGDEHQDQNRDQDQDQDQDQHRADSEPPPGEKEPLSEDRDDHTDPDDPRRAPVRKIRRNVVAGLPRAPTFKRQQSELRDKLMPAELTLAERRALSADRRLPSNPSSEPHHHPRPAPLDSSLWLPSSSDVDLSREPIFDEPQPYSNDPAASVSQGGTGPEDETVMGPLLSSDPLQSAKSLSKFSERSLDPYPDTASVTTSVYDQMIHDDLERIWILNLSMHFRDKSKREKFFITYRQSEHVWRRVTISLDYRESPENSLELDLEHTKFQREKNAKIYEAIRESLPDIQFYDTVTNLKLQTTDGRLHVHVVEDVNEIIHFPTIPMVRHLNCRRIKEREIHFDAHMSGFVYKVRVHGRSLIKKEIPGPDTVDEFLYEVNALTQLQNSRNVIELYGIIVDDQEEKVKGLLISYAENGALVDMIYDHDHHLPWPRREKWARQIVEGLSEIHEAGFVQGDFTLSNIVIDADDNAKIIDINRRGCPVGWEPPEATPLIESNQRISMYIGVKSDLYQLGMVLWALATQEDEPEQHRRPLRLDPDTDCPRWFNDVTHICLADDPRHRLQAARLMNMFPRADFGYEGGMTHPHLLGHYNDHPSQYQHHNHNHHHHHQCSHATSASLDSSISGYNNAPIIRTINSPPPDWSYKTASSRTYVDGSSANPYRFPMRGRSPPSPIASNRSGEIYGISHQRPACSAYSYDQNGTSGSSVSDAGPRYDDDDDNNNNTTDDDDDDDDGEPRRGRSLTCWSVRGESVERDEEHNMGASLVVHEDLALDTSFAHGEFYRNDVTPRPENATNLAQAITHAAARTDPAEDLKPEVMFSALEMRPDTVPLPPSPPQADDWTARTETETESEHPETDDGGARICPSEDAEQQEEPAGYESEWYNKEEPLSLLSTTQPPRMDFFPGLTRGIGGAVGGASLTPVAETPQTMVLVGSPKIPWPQFASLRGTPCQMLSTDLTGVGSAHDMGHEEAMRSQVSIEDELAAKASTATCRAADGEEAAEKESDRSDKLAEEITAGLHATTT